MSSSSSSPPNINTTTRNRTDRPPNPSPTNATVGIPSNATDQPNRTLTTSRTLTTARKVKIRGYLRRNELLTVPIQPLLKHLRGLIIRKIDFSVPPDAFTSNTELNLEVLRPLVQHVRDIENIGSVYCLLYLCRQFKESEEEDSGAKDLWRTRADICEIVATRLLKWYEDNDLINALFGEFSPRQLGRQMVPERPNSRNSAQPESRPPSATQPIPMAVPKASESVPSKRYSLDSDGQFSDYETSSNAPLLSEGFYDSYYPDENLGSEDDEAVEPYGLWMEDEGEHDDRDLRESTMSIAIDAHAIRFCAHPWTQEIIEDIWNGDIIIVRDDEEESYPAGLGGPKTLNRMERADSVMVTQTKDGVADLVNIVPRAKKSWKNLLTLDNVFDLSRLRVPKYQYWCRVLTMAVMLAFFMVTLHKRSAFPQWYEWVFYLLALSYIMDEGRQLWDGGIRFYLSDMWTWFDCVIMSIFIAFFALRMTEIRDGGETELPSYNVLATASALLWPRFAASLDRIRFFGLYSIIIKHMIAQAWLFLVPMVFLNVGFGSTIFAIAQGTPELSESVKLLKVLGALAEVFTGFYWNIYDWAVEMGMPTEGMVAILVFVGIVNLLYMSFLIAIFSQAYSDIVERADAEFAFDLTYRVVEHTLWQEIHPYLPPYNIVEPFVGITKFCLTRSEYYAVNRFVLTLLCWPVLMFCWFIEVIEYWWESRTKAGYNRQALTKELMQALEGDVDSSKSFKPPPTPGKPVVNLKTEKTDTGKPTPPQEGRRIPVSPQEDALGVPPPVARHSVSFTGLPSSISGSMHTLSHRRSFYHRHDDEVSMQTLRLLQSLAERMERLELKLEGTGSERNE